MGKVKGEIVSTSMIVCYVCVSVTERGRQD